MSTQSNIATTRRLIEECFNEGQLDVIDEICAPDVVQHDPSMPQEMVGTEVIKAQLRRYLAAFPDLHLTIDDVFASRDEVVIRWTGEGTNTGDLQGFPPTGRRAVVTGISIDRMDATGRICEGWNQWNLLGVIQQLGIAEQLAAAQSR